MPGTDVAQQGVQATPAAPAVRFTVASRPQRRFSNSQSVSNLASATSFQPIQLPAVGFVRKITMQFSAAMACASAGAVVAGDAPFNLLANITLTDATGQPIQQPISGYNLYLVNKYLSTGSVEMTNQARFQASPQLGPEFNYAATATTGTAVFRLDIDLEQDWNNGYGCVPNLDSNASLQLKIDVNQYTVAWTGTTVSAATVAVRVSQWYWAPVSAQVGGVSAMTTPTGFGDYVETRYETQTVSASAENTVNVTNRGGQIKGILAISRAAGVRTALTATTNIGLLLDNNPIDEGIILEEQVDFLRRVYGYIGTDLALSYAPLTAGTLPGLDRGVMVWPFCNESGGRDSWLTTRIGSLLQLKITPGASATTLELVTILAQVRDPQAFFAQSSLN